MGYAEDSSPRTTQDIWDELLVTAWFHAPYVDIRTVLKQGPSCIDFHTLKRIPPPWLHGKNVAAFVENQLPKLHKLLVRCRPDQTPAILRALAKSGMEICNIEDKQDTIKRNEARRLRTGSRRAVRYAARAHDRTAYMLETHARRSWGTCK